MLDLDPTGIWDDKPDPLKTYGTDKAFNLVATHCTRRVGGPIELPKFYRFRPAVVIVRNPVKVPYSHFVGSKKRDKDFKLSLDEFLFGGFLKFYCEYSNRVYVGIGSKQKVFVSYQDLLLEQHNNDKKTWEQLISFVLGRCDESTLALALNNNNAKSTAEKRYTNTLPSNMSDLHGDELNIKDSVEHWLSQQLDPNIRRFFEEKIFFCSSSKILQDFTLRTF